MTTRINLGRDSSGRRCVVDRRTLDMLDAAGRRAGHHFTIVQGCYVEPGKGAAASALTHAGGGVVDLRTWDLAKDGVSVAQAVAALEDVGFAPFFRNAAQGFPDEHIHAVAIGCPDLHPQAAAQVVDFRNRRNGLVGHGRYVGHWQQPRLWERVQARVARRRFLARHPQLAAAAATPTARRRFLAGHHGIARAWYALGGAR